ncbi:hypothetical protein [Hyphococcus sp.]|uniref:hypothetical protein n=1 Tax=Hyphococcus sp. TaxID=2038636 RepID=UPI00208394CE|nr:MAG: hypothetical protein DHS20C04_32460 [Marinicaulis sp.]
MKMLIFAALAAMFAPASLAAPAPDNTLARTKESVRDFIQPQISEQAGAGAFKVPPTDGTGGWIQLCLTELRYIAFTDEYVHSGFAKTPDDVDYYFGVTESGIILSPASNPVLVPITEGFVAPATPDLWSFLREAAENGKWVQFYAWEADKNGVQRVTQVRRLYPGLATGPCPSN